VGKVLPYDSVVERFNLYATARPETLSGFLNSPKKPGIMLEPVVEPVIF
jgi:hypothetical protein